MKSCSTCGLEKEDNLFRKNRGQCIQCYKQSRAHYRLNNKDKIKKDSTYYYENNKDKRKLFLTENKKSLNYKRRVRTKIKYDNDPNFRLRKLVSGSVLQSLFTKGSSKNGSVLEYLPYTIQELKEHLEKQFESWMTWDNLGKYKKDLWNDQDPATWTWQIDHIIPHSTFQYISMEDQAFRDCWVLENLRPYSAKQNWLDGINRTRH